ncbi:MAG TPA: NmrA family NAD(P)-binding protein [Candidatus Acidoferrum sp.]|jgi:uncharacterized protein YbjT (DUF2867 family)
MYVVLGATGNTGSVAARKLLERGEKVRAVGRDAGKLAQFFPVGGSSVVKSGAEPGTGADAGSQMETAVADASDAAALTRTFEGATAAYVLLPPRAKDPELLASGDKMSTAITEAIRASGISHVVLLSSLGAQHEKKTGPILALHAFEEKLKRVPNLNALFLRPAIFFENFLMLIPLVRSMGFLAGGIDGDLKIPQIATRDIGEAAAEALQKRDFSGITTRELHGRRNLSHNEAAKAIGAVIGKPKLSYKHFPAFLLEQGMKQMGIPGKTASLMSELNEAVNDGRLKPLEERTEKNTTATSIEDWAREVFAAAYNAKATAGD